MTSIQPLFCIKGTLCECEKEWNSWCKNDFIRKSLNNILSTIISPFFMKKVHL